MDQKTADLLNSIASYAVGNNAQLQTIRSFVQDTHARIVAIEERLAKIESRLNVIRRNQADGES